MENISVPVTALIVIFIGFIVLTMAAMEQGRLFAPGKKEKQPGETDTSDSEHMVWRFLLSDRTDVAIFFRELFFYLGKSMETVTLLALNKYIATERRRLDRAYALKGYAFSKSGDLPKAIANYRLALQENSDCALARLGLSELNSKNRSPGKVGATWPATVRHSSFKAVSVAKAYGEQ